MSKKNNENNKLSLPPLAQFFAASLARDEQDYMLDDDAEKHAVRGIETLTYGFGEDEETTDLMRDFAAISNPVDGSWTVVPRPRAPGIDRIAKSDNGLEYVGEEIFGVMGSGVRLLAPKL